MRKLMCGLAVLSSGCAGHARSDPFASGPLPEWTTPTKDLGPVGKPLSDAPLVDHLPAVGMPEVLSSSGLYGLARAPVVLVDPASGAGPDELLIYWRTSRPLPRRRAYAFVSVDDLDGLPGESAEEAPPGYSFLVPPACYETEAFEVLGYRPGQRRRFTLDVRRGPGLGSRLISRTVVRVKLHGIRSDEQGRDVDGTDDRRFASLGCTPDSP